MKLTDKKVLVTGAGGEINIASGKEISRGDLARRIIMKINPGAKVVLDRRRKRIILIGGGGHAKVVIDALRKSGEYEIHGIVDPGLKKGTAISGVTVLGDDGVVRQAAAKGVREAHISIGSIGDCRVRKLQYLRLKGLGFKFPAIVHRNATVAEGVELGEGAFVAAGVVINPGTRIGRNAIINTSSSIDHDCDIGDFVHVGPGATLSGGVEVGPETHIGTGAAVTQYVHIGRRCMVGAGVTLRRNLTDGQRYCQNRAGTDAKK